MNTAQLSNPFSGKANIETLKSDKSKIVSLRPKVSSFHYNKLVGYILYTVAFVLPFFFLPVTFDAFILNKTYLVVVSALLMLVLQSLLALLGEKYEVKSISNYTGIVAVLLAGGLATLYSTNKHISLYGTVGNYNNSMIALAGLVVLAYVVSNEKVRLKTSLFALAWGSVIASVVSTLLFFNVNLLGFNGSYVGFNLSGDMSNFRLLEILASVTFLYYLSTKQVKGKFAVVLTSIGFLLSGFGTLIFGDLVFNGLFVAIAAVVLTHAVKRMKTGQYVKKTVLPTLLLLAFIAGLTFVPTIRRTLHISNAVPDPRLTVNQSWNISASVIRILPLTGSGIGTFVTDASMYKPVSVNAGKFWNNKFNTASSDIFFILATMGVVGLIAYLLLWFWLFKTISRVDIRDGQFFLRILVAVLLFGSFFYSLNIVTWFVVFMLIGLSIQKTKSKTVEIKSPLWIGSMLLVSIIMLGLVLYEASFVYRSQYHFRKAVFAKDYKTRYQEERLAIKFTPAEGYYRQRNINTAITMALILSKNNDAKDTVTSLVESSILESRVITELIDPNNSTYWETRAFAYGKLIGLIKGVEQKVIEAATNAVQLEPVNPRLWLSLGNYYYAIGDKNNAANAFVQAVRLKNDYANAHYNLAQVLVDLKDYKNALIQLQITARLVSKNKSDFESVSRSIEELKKVMETANETTDKISSGVEAVKNIPDDGRNPGAVEPIEGTQEALSKPGIGDEEALSEGTELPSDVIDTDKPVTPETGSGAPLAKPPVSD